MIERVARAIGGVNLFSRFNNWTSDRTEGFPVEICRYGLGDEDEIIVVARFSREVPEYEALETEVSKEQARAAIEAMLEPNNKMLHEAAKAMSPGRRPTPDRVSVNEKHKIRYQAMIREALK